jgi:LysR family glycine cleavage system transcriptional activator
MTTQDFIALEVVFIMAKNSINNLPLEWVRVFEAAGRIGSFTAAAEEIGLTQAAVSQRIRNLEERIGARLFSRQARGVTLTVEGEAWLPHVTNALQALNRSAGELFGQSLEKLVVSASTSITQLWVVPRLAALSGSAGIQISMTTMNIEADFAKANAVVEIRYGNGPWPGMHSARLFRETQAPLAAPQLLQKSVRWQNLPRISIAGPRPGWQQWAAQTGDSALPVPRYRFDNLVSALAAAKAGVGVVLGSLPLCTHDLRDKLLVRLTEETLVQDAGYWMTAKETLPVNQWDELEACFCE